MGYNPGASGISGASDVALNSVQNDNVLSYDSGIAKWKNASTPAPTLANVPAGTTITRYGTGSTVPARGTSRSDITVLWRTEADPAANAVNGVDIWLRP